MKRVLLLSFWVISTLSLIGQNTAKSDNRTPSQNVVVKAEGTTGTFIKQENENTPGTSAQVLSSENVTFSTTANGINVTINGGTNKVQLFALTGQLIFNGDLKQGRFFIPTREGIYFLKVNNKSHKVVCK